MNVLKIGKTRVRGDGMFKGKIEKIMGFLLICVLAFNFFFVINTANIMNSRYDQIDKNIRNTGTVLVFT